MFTSRGSFLDEAGPSERCNCVLVAKDRMAEKVQIPRAVVRQLSIGGLPKDSRIFFVYGCNVGHIIAEP
jgi:hypothetical protein